MNKNESKCMIVNTKPFGEMEVDERQQLYFPFGLFGFENMKKFVLLDAAQQPFFWLQSVEVVEIAFVLIDPRLFRNDYSVSVSKAELAEIEIESEEDIIDFAIVTIPENPSKMTANLQGPVIVNKKKKIGRQVISSNKNWKTRHYIMDELKMLEQKTC